MRSILSYVLLAERGRTCTFDLMVSEVTALFTTGKGIAGERATSPLDRQNAGLPCHHERPKPRHAGPRGTGSTVRFGDRRGSNPLYQERSIRSLHHQRTDARPQGRQFQRPRNAAENKRRGAAKAQLGTQKCINRCRGALIGKRRAAERTPSKSAPPSVDRANRSRAVPSGGPRASDRRAKRHAVPGSGSPVPPKAAD
jgi:hypothetical protein